MTHKELLSGILILAGLYFAWRAVWRTFEADLDLTAIPQPPSEELVWDTIRKEAQGDSDPA